MLIQTWAPECVTWTTAKSRSEYGSSIVTLAGFRSSSSLNPNSTRFLQIQECACEKLTHTKYSARKLLEISIGDAKFDMGAFLILRKMRPATQAIHSISSIHSPFQAGISQPSDPDQIRAQQMGWKDTKMGQPVRSLAHLIIPILISISWGDNILLPNQRWYADFMPS